MFEKSIFNLNLDGETKFYLVAIGKDKVTVVNDTFESVKIDKSESKNIEQIIESFLEKNKPVQVNDKVRTKGHCRFYPRNINWVYKNLSFENVKKFAYQERIEGNIIGKVLAIAPNREDIGNIELAAILTDDEKIYVVRLEDLEKVVEQ